MSAYQKSNVGVTIVISCIITTLVLRVFEFRKKIIILEQENLILQKENDSLRHITPAIDYTTQKPCAGC